MEMCWCTFGYIPSQTHTFYKFSVSYHLFYVFYPSQIYLFLTFLSQKDFEVEYTTAKPVEGLQGVGEWTWDIKVPVNAVWKLLPWNKGKAPTAKVTLLYADDDFRIVADGADELFVYTRPVSSRPY